MWRRMPLIHGRISIIFIRRVIFLFMSLIKMMMKMKRKKSTMMMKKKQMMVIKMMRIKNRKPSRGIFVRFRAFRKSTRRRL